MRPVPASFEQRGGHPFDTDQWASGRSDRVSLSLRQRFSPKSRDAAPSGAAAERALTARYAAYLFAGGATLCLTLIALPHPSATSELGVALTALGAYGGAVITLLGVNRIPLWGLKLLAAIAVLTVSVGFHFNDDATGAIVVGYVAAACFGFYLFRWAEAATYALLIAICGAVVLANEPIDTGVELWGVTVVILLFVGLLIGQLRDRVDSLLARLADATRTDELTGLLNRRGFDALFDLELERARRTEQPLGVIVGDLDRLSELNERFGRRAGDEALRATGAVVSAMKRRVDVAARLGGEEFVLLLPNTDRHGAYLVAERLRGKVARAFDGYPFTPTISFGVASFPAHGKTTGLLLEGAEQALRAAKLLGRDRSVVQSGEIAAARAYSAEQTGRLAAVLALAETVDVRHNGDARHSQAVARHAELIAREFGLPAERVERVRLAGLLHDIGNVSVSDSILKKPGPLTHEEWETVHEHPVAGAGMLEGRDLEDVREWVLAHHERPDGLGYPRGLRSYDIPLEAKMLAVADAYEAMVSGRSYRPAVTPDEARAELLRCAGSQFDSRVVEAFLRVLDRQGLALGAPGTP
jgi:diguanylate cyclase (GGDEF)-like protein/putative nucleotidyltransferase with HDIG domain